MNNHGLAVEIRLPGQEVERERQGERERESQKVAVAPRENFAQEEEAHRVRREREAQEFNERRLHVADLGRGFRKMVL